MALTKITTFVDEEFNEVSFVPVSHLTGYTHHIVYNGLSDGWLDANETQHKLHSPSAELAESIIRHHKKNNNNWPPGKETVAKLTGHHRTL